MKESLLVAQLAEREIRASNAEVPPSPSVTAVHPTPPPHARSTESWSYSSSMEPVIVSVPATTAESSAVGPGLPEVIEPPEAYQSRWDESRKGRGFFRGQRGGAVSDADESELGE